MPSPISPPLPYSVTNCYSAVVVHLDILCTVTRQKLMNHCIAIRSWFFTVVLIVLPLPLLLLMEAQVKLFSMLERNCAALNCGSNVGKFFLFIFFRFISFIFFFFEYTKVNICAKFIEKKNTNCHTHMYVCMHIH